MSVWWSSLKKTAKSWDCRLSNFVPRPEVPTQISKNRDITGRELDVADSGDYAYIADGEDGFVVLDISNPAVPTKIGNYKTRCTWGVEISGNYAYIADWTDGLVVFDISDPTAPTFAGHYFTAGYAQDVAVSGNYAYVADTDNGLLILRIAPQSSTPIDRDEKNVNEAIDYNNEGSEDAPGFMGLSLIISIMLIWKCKKH